VSVYVIYEGSIDGMNEGEGGGRQEQGEA